MSSLQSAIHYFLQPLYSDPLVARVQVMEGEGFKCKVVCGSCGKSVVVTASGGEEGGEGLRWPTNWDVHLRGHHSSRRLSGSGKDVRSHPYQQNGRTPTPKSPPPSASSKKRSFAESVSERNRDRPSPHSTTPSPRPPYSPQSPLPPPPPNPPPPSTTNPHSPTHLEHLRYLELTEDPSILSLEPYRALCRGCHTWISLGGEGEDGGVRYSVFRWSRHVGGRGCKGLRKKEKEEEGYGGGGLEYVSRPLEPIPIRRSHPPSPPNPDLPPPPRVIGSSASSGSMREHRTLPPHTPSPPDLPPPPHLIGSSTSGSMLSHRTLPPLVPSSYPPIGQANGRVMGPRPELALPIMRREREYEVLPPPSTHRQSYSPPSPPPPRQQESRRSPMNGHNPERLPKQNSPRLALPPYPSTHPPLQQVQPPNTQHPDRVPNQNSPRLVLSRYPPPHPQPSSRSTSMSPPGGGKARSPPLAHNPERPALSPYPTPHPLPHPLTHRQPQRSRSRERLPSLRDGNEVYEYRPLVPIPIHPQPQKESLRPSAREKERGRSISISSLLSSEPSPPSPPSPRLQNGGGRYYRDRDLPPSSGAKAYYRASPPPSVSRPGEYYRSRQDEDLKGRDMEREGDRRSSTESALGSSTVVVRLEPADEDVDVEMKHESHVLVPASWDERRAGISLHRRTVHA